MLRLFLTTWLMFISTQSYAGIHPGPRQLEEWKPRPLSNITACSRYCDVITRFAQQYQVPKNLIIAVIKKRAHLTLTPSATKGLKVSCN